MPRLRQLPWIPILLSTLLLVGAAFATDPIRDAIVGGPVADARLDRSLAYVTLGPISSVLDALTLFTVGQIVGFTLWVFGLYALGRYLARLDRPVAARREVAYAIVSLLCLIAVYAAAVLLPRPMAQLIVTRSDAITVDFHSHTQYSHDGRPGWSAADVRDWHAAAGYDAAYVTDHATLDGVREALALDSTVAGQGTVLLPGIEAFYHGEHVNLLNAGTRYRGLVSVDLRDIDAQALSLASQLPNVEPVLIETIPGDLSSMIPATGPGTAGVRAIEIIDGSPRGMSQAGRDRARILHLADSLHLALVSGSDNHGWGRATPGWTMLRIDRWRGLSPEALSLAIESILRLGGAQGTHVVERVTASASPLAVAFALPTVAWTVSRTLSADERIAWAFWIWIPWLVIVLVRRRGSNPAT